MVAKTSYSQPRALSPAVADLGLVRPMNTRTIVAVLALLVIGITARAENSTRMLMYTFQDGAALIHVGLIDTPPAPRGFVACPTSPRRQKAFSVSRHQFEQAWRALQSSGVEKFAGAESANRMFDAAKNYVFSVAHMPNGPKTNFVVPKTRASGALVSLARQFEAYAR
jgi:hypothetical protein